MALVLVEKRDRVAIVTLNDPDRRNSLNGPMVDEIVSTFDQLEADDDVGAVVITGAFTDPRSGAKVSRPDVTRMVEQAAATTASSVSASTDYLLAGENVGASKTNKADKLGVTVVQQEELWRWLAEAGVA